MGVYTRGDSVIRLNRRGHLTFSGVRVKPNLSPGEARTLNPSGLNED